MGPPSLARLTWIFMRVGNLTFGGGDPTMAALNSELVVTRRWLSPEQYGLAFGLARVTPGTNVLAFCAAIAWQLLGWPGAVMAVLGESLPSAVIVLLLSAGYESWTSTALALAAIGGVLAAAVGMMAAGSWQLVRAHLTSRRWLRAAVLAPAALALSLLFSMPPIQVLALAALVGLIWRTP